MSGGSGRICGRRVGLGSGWPRHKLRWRCLRGGVVIKTMMMKVDRKITRGGYPKPGVIQNPGVGLTPVPWKIPVGPVRGTKFVAVSPTPGFWIPPPGGVTVSSVSQCCRELRFIETKPKILNKKGFVLSVTNASIFACPIAHLKLEGLLSPGLM